MFGIGKAARLREIEQRFGQILTVLSSGGNQRATEAIEGMRAALEEAAERARAGASDSQIAAFLASNSKHDRGETSGRSFGYLYIALIYEARSLGTKDAYRLASQIQEMAYQTMQRFSGPRRSGTESRQHTTDHAPASDEVSDEGLEPAIRLARLLQNVLRDMGIYEGKPGILLRPHALGYLWGWCDATTQKLGLEENSGESLGVCSAMFISFFENKNFDSESEEGFDCEVLIHANKLREEMDEKFFEGMRMGGSDLFAFVGEGGFSEDMVEHIADIFSDEYYANFRS